MYICICKSVTDKQIRREAQNGTDNLYELRQKLGVSSVCGTCGPAAQEILDNENYKKSDPILYIPTNA